MRIAFIGKGGAGKTSSCVLFAQYACEQGADVLVVDADINTHVPKLLGFDEIPREKHVSHPDVSVHIRQHLAGTNPRIASPAAFRKTTPPGSGSNLIFLEQKNDPILSTYSIDRGGLRLMVVGTYHEDDIGTSCYHNHLATFENVLTHLVDDRGILVADMVAGIDAFASTLHAQFDLMVLAVEPTWRSIEVYEQYAELARNANCLGTLWVIGNKVRSKDDEAFIRNNIPNERILGCFMDSEYLRKQDKVQGVLNIQSLEDENRKTLACIYQTLLVQPFAPQDRLKKIHELHKRYVAQSFIRERFGDLTKQIDEEFDLRDAVTKRRAE